jgi:hypothetical protein
LKFANGLFACDVAVAASSAGATETLAGPELTRSAGWLLGTFGAFMANASRSSPGAAEIGTVVVWPDALVLNTVVAKKKTVRMLVVRFTDFSSRLGTVAGAGRH